VTTFDPAESTVGGVGGVRSWKTRGRRAPSSRPSTGRCDLSDYRGEVTFDSRRFETDHAIAGAHPPAISTRVSAHPAQVIAAIDLDDEPMSQSERA